MNDIQTRIAVLTYVASLGAAAILAPACGAQTINLTPPSASQVSPEPDPILSPKVLAAVAPVRQAIVRVTTIQARLPPPTNDRESLRRLRERDQAAWQAVSGIDFSDLPPEQKAAAKAVIGSQLEPFDQANQDALLRILPPEGWFSISRYGAEGEEAAYLIVLHSDIDLWRRFTPVVGRFAAIGEAKGAHYALLSDRLAAHEGRPQSYGSQITCEDGVYKPYPIDDPEHLDERRLHLGMTPYATFLKTFAGLSC